MNNEFEQRLAVVTGAKSGLGLATTEMLLAQGAKVAAIDLWQAGEVASSSPSSLIRVACDVTSPTEVEVPWLLI